MKTAITLSGPPCSERECLDHLRDGCSSVVMIFFDQGMGLMCCKLFHISKKKRPCTSTPCLVVICCKIGDLSLCPKQAMCTPNYLWVTGAGVGMLRGVGEGWGARFGAAEWDLRDC